LNFDDIKERLIAFLQNAWDEFQESPTYTRIKDRYDSLSGTQQRIVWIAGASAIALSILSVPYGSLSNSLIATEEFSEKRQLIRDLLKSSREAKELPNIPVPPPIDAIRASVERELQSARIQPEQIKGNTQISEASSLVPNTLNGGGLLVQLAKLNLRQIVDLAHQFSAINPSVKLKDINISANVESPQYFDVNYKLVALKVPEITSAGPGSAGPDGEPNFEATPGEANESAEEVNAEDSQESNSEPIPPPSASGKRPRQVR
jgi:hypothetical protein